MHHHLPATRENLHGHFSRELAAVLTIDPGDIVTFQCLEGNWALEPNNGVEYQRKHMERRDGGLDSGHALTGPVFIRGAQPGRVLKIKIETLELGDWGTTFVGGWPSDWNKKLCVEEKGIFMTWTYENGIATNQFGHQVRTAPFMGVMGMPVNEPGIQSTIPPRLTGGNLDCKELVQGTTLYLPIEVEGALFSVGDGHGAQGDGEVCSTAIETPMEAVTLSFDVVDFPFRRPVAETPAGWVGMGIGATLDEAMLDAIEVMAELMNWLYGYDRLTAIGLCSVAVDFRVTQVVNEVVGVHGVLGTDSIKRI